LSSGSTLLSLTNSGSGAAVVAASVSGNGLSAISNSSGVGSAAVYGSHINGEGIVGESSGASVGAVVGRHDANGYGVYGVNTGSGTGVRGETSGPGIAGEFRNGSPSSTNYTLRALSGAMGTVLDIEALNPSFTGALAAFSNLNGRVARIDYTGKGFFNGGTQTGGADVAEAFETAEPVSAYEPGDVLVIATTRNRTVERSTVAHSTRVAGVYATKPGVLLTERDIEADQGDTVPMGVIGVIPTKVSGESGAIQRGDLLVTSSTPGHAMRAGAQPAAGTIIGKALEPFDGAGTGRINVLVSIR
jgi:hypothetical protein